MKTGFRGAFVISWTQTEIDGLDAPDLSAVVPGAVWSWRGDVVRVDGPNEILRLDRAEGSEALRVRAARKVTRLVGAALDRTPLIAPAEDGFDDLRDRSFVLTDGAQIYTATLIEAGRNRPPLLLFVDELPPRETELWVVRHSLRPDEPWRRHADGGVICFTRGTRIDTPSGPRLIESLREGDTVLTLDDGPQQILWIGARRMSGARLFAMPELRPIRLRVGALGVRRPDQELLVSPEHRMLLSGRHAKTVFNEPEVLVTARDLVDDKAVTVDVSMREVTYIHLLFARHQIIRANGIPTESFHPASAALSSLDATDRERLVGMYPVLAADPYGYGGFARRNLTASEAAILQSAA